MSEMPIVVLDPGHGGARGTHNRGSSWNRAEGPNGLLEKNVAFDLALRVAARLRDHARVELTRSEQANPSLGERAGVAKRLDAALFLSLHLNASADPEADGTDVYFAHDAAPAARAFGDAVLRRLRAVTHTTRGALGVRDLGTLLSARHSPRTAACLTEIAYLSNPRQARALGEEGYRNEIADALADAIREHLAAPRALVQSLDIGQGSPFVAQAVEHCWDACQRLRLSASDAANPAAMAAQRIRTESGVGVDVNPYVGITRPEIEAVIRAGFTSHAMPEVLLAIWAKEGSTRSVTSAVAVPQALSDAHARTIFRSRVFYEDLGADKFLITTRRPGQDNRWDSSDAAAARHETHFAQLVAQLNRDGHLQEDIAAAVNGELTVTRSGATRSVLPSTRFYALSLMLVDALWKKFQGTSNALLPSITDEMNYMQWNMGTASFGTFLTSAENHRREPAHQLNGEAISIEQWALHTAPRANEYRQPRTNAIKFHHYIESYRPIFAGALNLIKPGIEDLRANSHAAEVETASVSEALAITTFPNNHLFQPPREFVRMPVTSDEISGSFGSATLSTTTAAKETDLRAQFPGEIGIPDPASSTNFLVFAEAEAALASFFRSGAGGNIEAALDSVICYPSDGGDPDKLDPRQRRYPVAIVVMGNHTAVDAWSATAVAPPVFLGVARDSAGNPVTLTTTRARPTGATPHDNHLGYCSLGAIGAGTPYLQEELARIGFVSMSISTNGANLLNLLVEMRGQYILQYLDQLRRFNNDPRSRFHDKLDFTRVALIGHSRGGDAVVKAAKLNLQRSPATRFGIRSVISVSPTDMTGVLATTATQKPLSLSANDGASYCILYGAEDGDVIGGGDGAHGGTGTGFRYYDRSDARRAMVFIHGANHNRFNREWPDEAPPVATSITRLQQETLAKEYVSGWLRFTMLGDSPQQDLFNGTSANSLTLPVSLMWKFGRSLETIERFQDTNPARNTLNGAVTEPSYVTEVAIDTENPADLVIGGGVLLPTIPHVDRVVRAAVATGTSAPLREGIPAGHNDVRRFSHLTFRVTKLYPTTSAATIAAAPLPDFTLTLEDGAGHRATLPGAAVRAANPLSVRPYFHTGPDFELATPGAAPPLRNMTKCNLETWRVPLPAFTAALPALALGNIKAVEFDFAAVAGEPVYVDTISFVTL
jgi:N-acetylmuramoyl-L-alanine amidase